MVLPQLDGTPYRVIFLSTRYDIFCLVDEDQYPWLIQTNWNWGWHAKTPWKHYVKRNSGPERSTIYMHREIMIRSDPRTFAFQCEHHVHHCNGQTLDNRRANFEWLTPKENGAIKHHRTQIPSLGEIVAGLIGSSLSSSVDVPFHL